jgi:hypothetical protein
MTWVNGKIVYGSTDGTLRTVPFDPTGGVSGFAADGAAATVLAPATAEATWSKSTLYFYPS